jgi:signal transduction histidine kinase
MRPEGKRATKSGKVAMPFAPRRRATLIKVMPSVLIDRLCMVLLVAPWVILLALKSIFAANSVTSSMFFLVLFLELSTVTLCGLALVSARIRELKHYEAGREHERLLFSYARDAMLLVRVHGNPSSASQLCFVIQAENPAAVERLNSIGQAESYVGVEVQDAFPNWLHGKIRREYAACVATQRVHRYEVCYPDGRLAHESVATPVIDPATKRVSHIVVIMRDIAERMAQEKERYIALKKAEAANKAKSEFLASMSHELRTPLNAIIGFSSALGAGIAGPLSEKQKDYASMIQQSGNHLLGIISDILDLSKIEAGRVTLQEEAVSLDDIIEAAASMIKGRAASKSLALKLATAPNLPSLRADPLRIKQILVNLLSNAVKFTESGSVTLETRFDPFRGFELFITDTGIGMDEDGVRIALQPFGQVESAFSRNHDGTGLGLPIAAHLTRLHGGALKVSSSPGLGTRVTVNLPASRAQTLNSHPELLEAAV